MSYEHSQMPLISREVQVFMRAMSQSEQRPVRASTVCREQREAMTGRCRSRRVCRACARRGSSRVQPYGAFLISRVRRRVKEAVRSEACASVRGACFPQRFAQRPRSTR